MTPENEQKRAEALRANLAKRKAQKNVRKDENDNGDSMTILSPTQIQKGEQ